MRRINLQQGIINALLDQILMMRITIQNGLGNGRVALRELIAQ